MKEEAALQEQKNAIVEEEHMKQKNEDLKLLAENKKANDEETQKFFEAEEKRL